MSVATISPAKLAELAAGRPEDRTDRRSHAGRISRSPSGDRPQCSPGPTRSQSPDAGPQRIGRRTAVRDLQIGRAEPAGLREVHQGRLHQCRQRRGRHDGLHRGGLAGRSRQEGHFAGAASPHRRRIARVVGSDRIVHVLPAVDLAVGLRRRRPGVCRNHRHLRDGHAPGPHAVEPVQSETWP